MLRSMKFSCTCGLRGFVSPGHSASIRVALSAHVLYKGTLPASLDEPPLPSQVHSTKNQATSKSTARPLIKAQLLKELGGDKAATEHYIGYLRAKPLQ